ncbi:MAG: helix-turn-helix transcriptional regulator [Candidatus Dojkabacteria bacterium]
MQSQKIGKKVRYFRLRALISQLKLERLIEASDGSLSRLESGKVNPTKETLFAIAEALDLSKVEIAYLFGIVENIEIGLVKEVI